MVKLAALVHIANNAKTEEQRNAVATELKKVLVDAKGCDPESQLMVPRLKKLKEVAKGTSGQVFYGCLDNKCKTKVAIKFTSEPSAKMEYDIAKKLKGMGVPRMYYFKTCDNKDILYFEYINGKSLEKWVKGNPTTEEYRSVISQVIGNLYKIHKKYPSFRHHDLHWNNILITKGPTATIIDFGLSTIDGITNPAVNSGDYKATGIYKGSHPMYDVHYFLNILFQFTKNIAVKRFILDLFPKEYLVQSSPYVKTLRLRAMKHTVLPTYENILKHPFLVGKKNVVKTILNRAPVKKAILPRKALPAKVPEETAFERAKRILQMEAEKKMKKEPIKRPAGRKPSVMSQVREIEAKIAPPRVKTSINKNGDLKIEKRKCRLYKKEELVKMFKLDPKLTKEQMCKFIKNM